MMGGVITLLTNYNATPGESSTASDSTYWTFLAVMCLGSLLSLFLLNPQDVVKADGSKVVVDKFPSIKKETIQIF